MRSVLRPTETSRHGLSSSSCAAIPPSPRLCAASTTISAASQQPTMFSFFRHKKKQHTPHIGADALPATATAVQEVEASAVSRRFAVEGKGMPNLPPGKTLALRIAVSYLPHPEKLHYGGEDAYFVSDVGGGAMGVADGVGGWQESGVNPADYSRLFMKLAQAYLEGTDIFANPDIKPNQPFIDPRGALHAAHEHTKVPGSATACVMQLDAENRTLEAANLGDSGFVVIRDGQIIARSKPLQHYFDCPLQFGAFPEFVEATDTADMADTYSIPLLPGDVIVAGSDGLWDNTFDSEICAMAPREPTAVQDSADRIVTTARNHASDNDFQSPYVREALSQGLDLPWWEKIVGATFKNGRFELKKLSGGKMDDITVIVALVDTVNLPPPQPEEPVTAQQEATQGTNEPTATIADSTVAQTNGPVVNSAPLPKEDQLAGVPQAPTVGTASASQIVKTSL